MIREAFDVAEKANKVVRSILAIGISISSFCLFYALIFKNVVGTEKDIILFILGSVTTILTQVVSYYFGSSHDKGKRIDDDIKITTEQERKS